MEPLAPEPGAPVVGTYGQVAQVRPVVGGQRDEALVVLDDLDDHRRVVEQQHPASQHVVVGVGQLAEDVGQTRSGSRSARGRAARRRRPRWRGARRRVRPARLVPTRRGQHLVRLCRAQQCVPPSCLSGPDPGDHEPTRGGGMRSDVPRSGVELRRRTGGLVGRQGPRRGPSHQGGDAGASTVADTADHARAAGPRADSAGDERPAGPRWVTVRPGRPGSGCRDPDRRTHDGRGRRGRRRARALRAVARHARHRLHRRDTTSSPGCRSRPGRAGTWCSTCRQMWAAPRSCTPTWPPRVRSGPTRKW